MPNRDPHDLKVLGLFHGLRDRRQQFIDILTQTSEKGFLLSFIIAFAHSYSDGDGSPIQRGSYVFIMALTFFFLKKVYTSEIENGLT